jgi:Divergent InlB B-repeat domain/Abnormal spindle-like microcephaly-assoc'd, ASPM-SPD-2-Hydin
MVPLRYFLVALVLTPVGAMKNCPPPKYARIAVSPATLTFAAQVVNTSASASSPQTVTITSTGNLNLNFSGISSTGDYSQTNNCPSSLSTGSSCTVQVTFTPNSLGTINGTLTVVSNAINGTQILDLSGTGLTPVGFSPASIDFGSVAVGTASAAQTVTLTNQQGTSLGITSVSTSGDYSQTNNCPASLAAGETCHIDVMFQPTLSATVPGAVVVVTDALTGTQPVGLSGSGSGTVTSQVSFSSATLNFGNGEAGETSASQTVTLTNTSNTQSLSITAVSASGAGYSEVDTCTGATIPPGENCTITAKFQPYSDLAPLTYSGAITVMDSDVTAPHVVGLSGVGVAPVTASPDPVNFGTIFPGTTATQTVTVTNNDSVAETVSIGSGGHFNLSNNCAAALPAGASCTTDISFPQGTTPTGQASGALTLTPSKGGFLSPKVVNLAACLSDMGLSPSNLNFGSVALGTTSDPQTVTLANTSGATVNFTDISIAGTNSGDFAVSANTCSPVLNGNQCNVQVTFTPAASGNRSGVLNFSDDHACSPQPINLVGGSSGGPFVVTISAPTPGSTGTVTSNPAGVNCSLDAANPCSGSFAAGTTATLTATPDPSSHFIGWGGVCSGTGSCLLNMTADKQVTATFAPNPNLSLTFVGNGNGTVISKPDGVNCTSGCNTSFLPGTVVSLTPTATSPSTFAGWSGACVGTGACSITMNSDQTVEVNFVAPDFSIAASPVSPAVVSAGISAQGTVTLTSTDKFSSAVNLTCSVDPTPMLAPTCSFSPVSVTPAANGAATSSLTINTSPPTNAFAPFTHRSIFYAVWLPVGGLAWIGIGFPLKSRKSKIMSALFVSCLITLVAVEAACGGGGSTTVMKQIPGTPSGTYTITVTGTSGSTQHSTSATVTVQ